MQREPCKLYCNNKQRTTKTCKKLILYSFTLQHAHNHRSKSGDKISWFYTQWQVFSAYLWKQVYTFTWFWAVKGFLFVNYASCSSVITPPTTRQYTHWKWELRCNLYKYVAAILIPIEWKLNVWALRRRMLTIFTFTNLADAKVIAAWVLNSNPEPSQGRWFHLNKFSFGTFSKDR